MAACTFSPVAPVGPFPDPDAATAPADAALRPAVDARAADASAPPAEDPLCDPADTALIGCFAFEDTAESQSGAGLVVTASGLVYGEGIRGRALDTRLQGALHIEETPALDFDAFTIEMWVHPDALPTGAGRAGLFDNDGQYSVFIFQNAGVRCSGSGSVLPEGVLATGTWTHLACVHDGQSVTLHVNGEARATGPAGPPPRGAINGSNVAGDSPNGNDRFVGRIDELRIWNRARTAAEVCAAARCAPP